MKVLVRDDFIQMIHNHEEHKLEHLLEKRSIDKNMIEGKEGEVSFLIEAVNANNLKAIKILLKYGAELNNDTFITPLEVAIDENKFLIASYLISRGAKLDGLLRSFAQDENLEAVKFLLQYGSDIHERDEDGWDAFYVAVTHNYLSLEVIKFLFSNGANINTRNNDDESVLEWILTASNDDYTDAIQFFVNYKKYLDEHNLSLLKKYNYIK